MLHDILQDNDIYQNQCCDDNEDKVGSGKYDFELYPQPPACKTINRAGTLDTRDLSCIHDLRHDKI